MSAEANLKAKNIVLPEAPRPVANYITALELDGLLYVSGHGPAPVPGARKTGKVGADLSVDEGYQAARLTGLGILATVRQKLGSLDRVERVVKLLGMVNAAPDFADHPKVINGCSDLFVEVFGEERGRGTRSAVGMGSLPGNIATEIEAVFQIAPPPARR
jgi:enamine deaminase RidA (YjgF/YER057c/UK114 family)